MTCGSVDDGKSTLIGRLLFDTKTILTDTLSQIEKTSKKRGMSALDLSLITDGLQAEREQGITIDVAYRYFSTGSRKYIIADAPGHEQYTRNMVTAASTAQLAIILVDARKGMLTQTRRHSYLTKLVGIKHIIVAINKMDLVKYSESKYKAICEEYNSFASAIKLSQPGVNIDFVPMSALNGDMIVDRGNSINWYKGPTLLEILENIDTTEKSNKSKLRFPVQYVCRPRDSANEKLHDFRAFMGRIESGLLKVNDKIKVLPSNHQSSVKEIRIGEKIISEATFEQSVTVSLHDEIDISRGDMLIHTEDILEASKSFTANVCWLSEIALTPNRTYLIMHTTRTSKAKISSINNKININSLEIEQASELKTNDIANISFKLAQPLIIDKYAQNRSTGAFIIVDESTFHTVGAGMIEAID
ncbi:MAG: sulfate adenylyltransferase [Nitrosomonadales bacterium]|nr:sulfate adenylyltransferase [Nitrosomonadales bacterium]MBT4759891.1 sulfate adenylyltransferase [Nitrosomonadales bacterium]MBT5573617.1 sulfate adenylyltransferase [Nitrosomonadales bacterium]MBT6251109.1 sulfate adenylyltransferase [Nitrosomonadales bacterium]MBT6602921.1 sulfate adenylyltransferase [Nitrosomonadales bacterium]